MKCLSYDTPSERTSKQIVQCSRPGRKPGRQRVTLAMQLVALSSGDCWLAVATLARRQTVNDVATLRHGGEMKPYIDLLFLTLIVLLCISRIVTN